MDRLRALLEQVPATDVAELFLSPHVAPRLVIEATRESGPTLWMVNRSDVYDGTLETLTQHPLTDIAARAKDKLDQRRSRLVMLAPPENVGPWNEVPDYAIEDVLGHPLCPWEAMLYFSNSPSEDTRASSALSLTRRLLEYPPVAVAPSSLAHIEAGGPWYLSAKTREMLEERFGEMLTSDPAPYARAYAARAPIHSSATLDRAASEELNPQVLSKILQNPATNRETLEKITNRITRGDFATQGQVAPLRIVLCLDSRLSASARDRLAQPQHPLLDAFLENLGPSA